MTKNMEDPMVQVFSDSFLLPASRSKERALG